MRKIKLFLFSFIIIGLFFCVEKIYAIGNSSIFWNEPSGTTLDNITVVGSWVQLHDTFVWDYHDDNWSFTINSPHIRPGVAILRLEWETTAETGEGERVTSSGNVYKIARITSSGSLVFNGTVTWPACTNGAFGGNFTFYLESDYPYSTENCPTNEDYVNQDGLCLKDTNTTPIIYSTDNCPTNEDYINQDGICLKNTTNPPIIYSTDNCPASENYIAGEGICLKPSVTFTPIPGVCGTASRTYPTGSTSFGSDTFCSAGTPDITPTFPTSANPESGWTCHGLYSGADSPMCIASLPVYCGNNIKESTEQCDGTDDSACPGNCGAITTSSVPNIELWADGSHTESSMGTSFDPYYTYFDDNRIQFIILRSELATLGFKIGDKITSIQLKDSVQPGRALANFRIRMKLTTASTTTSWEGGWPTTNFYYAASIAKNTFTPGTWKEFVSADGGGSGFIWDGTSNIMVDISRDDTTYSGSGGMYKRASVGTNRMYTGYCDNCSTAGPLALWQQTTGSLGSGYNYNYAPSLKITRTTINTTADSCTCPANAPSLSDLGAMLTPCYTLGASSVAFSWVYNGINPQTGYQIQIASNPANFDQPSINQCTDCEVSDGNTGTSTTTNYSVIVDDGGSVVDNKLHFSYKASDPTHPIQYYWRVRVSDGNHPLAGATWYYGTGTITNKANAVPFQTPLHPYPYVSFTPKVSPVILTATYANTIFYDSSTCFDNDGIPYNCACAFDTDNCDSTTRLNDTYKWWFRNTLTDWLVYVSANNPDSTAKPSLESVNKTAAFWAYRDPGIYKPVLQVCDDTTPVPYCCYGTSDMVVKSQGGVPTWQEVSPLE